MTELVSYIVTSLVDDKEHVSVTEDGDVITVRVAKDDMGRSEERRVGKECL